MWLRALPGTRVAVALAGTVPQLHVYGVDGTLAARAALPVGTSDLLVDPSGAMLVPSRGGELVAYDRDGAERWRLSLRETLRTPAAALPRGGVALATEGDQVLLITDGEG